jgi:hypothetical protein
MPDDLGHAGLVKALDESIQQIGVGTDSVTKPTIETPLPLRPNRGISASVKDTVPPLGQQLTGRQEHCNNDVIFKYSVCRG